MILPPLIESIRAYGACPRVHPNGFLQLNLIEDGSARLHVWHPDLPKQDVRTSVHDHVFHMRSVVKKGVLKQVRLDYLLNHKGAPTDEIYMAQSIGGDQTTLAPTGVRVILDHKSVDLISEGEAYEQPPFTFHDSVPYTDVVVTVMQKTYSVGGIPRVMVPIEQHPDNSFRRDDADVDFLWKIIEESV